MKIGQFDNRPAGVERPSAAGAERKADGVKGGTGTAASAQVALSPVASALAGDVAEGSFDQVKVERIAQAIRDGSYRINAEAIAEKLITNARELLGKADN